MHISRGFCEVDVWVLHEVCSCVHLGRKNERRDETETKPRETRVLQRPRLCAFVGSIVFLYC